MTKLALAAFAAAAFAFLEGVRPAHGALTPVEISCRDAIAKGTAVYAKRAFMTMQRCQQRRSSGERSLADDCNDAVGADNLGKLVKARTKTRSKVVSACAGADSLLSGYEACPTPAAGVDDGGATPGIDDFDELGRCLVALVDSSAGIASLDAMGHPVERLLAALVTCQQAAGRGAGAVLTATLSERRKCQHRRDGDGGGPEYSCDGEDGAGKIARARGTLAGLVFDRCDFIPSDELARLRACSDDAPALAECAGASAELSGAELIRNAYGFSTSTTTTTTTITTTTTTITLPVTCGSTFPQCNGACGDGASCQNTGAACQCVSAGGPCAPATILRHLRARTGEAGSLTQLSTGWTGKTHVVDVPDDSFDALDVDCDENCGNCAISLNKRVGDPTSNCRCSSDPRTTCTSVGGADAANCGSLDPACNCYFGPGLAISSGGTPVCVLNRLREDYGGSMDLRTGDYSDVIKLASLVHLGASQFAPCPTCDGDTTPGDGVRDGACNGGTYNGQACDVNGTHPTFGATSFDCPPTSNSNISGNGLQIDLHLATTPQALDATLPCDSPSGALCPCRVCSGNSQLGCSSDVVCAAASAGTCTAGGDVPIQPNQCTDGICSPEGFCEGGPVDKYCDGAVQPDGRGYVSCNSDLDCSVLGAGSCTVLDLRRCFPDPIAVSGHADVDNPVTGAVFCIPPTTNIAVNQTAGLPGPGTIQLDFDAEVRCQSDPGLVYQFPDGANCPDLVTTTTTTTTSITLPISPCGGATFPVCAGTCAIGQVCTPTLGATCACTVIQ